MINQQINLNEELTLSMGMGIAFINGSNMNIAVNRRKLKLEIDETCKPPMYAIVAETSMEFLVRIEVNNKAYEKLREVIPVREGEDYADT